MYMVDVCDISFANEPGNLIEHGYLIVERKGWTAPGM